MFQKSRKGQAKHLKEKKYKPLHERHFFQQCSIWNEW